MTPALLDAAEIPALEAAAGPLDALVTYTIDQTVDDVAGTFSGTARIRWVNPSEGPVGLLPLRLYANAPAETGLLAPRVKVSELTADRDVSWELASPTRLDVVFERPVEPGDVVVVDVAYAGRFEAIDASANDPFAAAAQQLGGLGTLPTGNYGLLGQGDGLFVMASAFPTVAPWREGAFDPSGAARVGDVAYNGMARFDVRTVVPEGVTIVTNLVDEAPATDASGVVVRSRGDGVRDLVLVGGRDLVKSTATVGETTVNSWYRLRDEAAGQKVLDVAGTALASYERRFGPYPYAELDVAEATLVGGAGGVEFSGLVLVAGLLYRHPEDSRAAFAEAARAWGVLGSSLGPLDPNAVQQASTQLLDDALEFTVAHEVAHQWFAGLVGNDSREEPTLDEPLAQYLATLAIEDRRGPDAAKAALERHVLLNYALWRALGGPDRAVARPTSDYTSDAEYAGLVYGKAPYAWVAARGKLGDDALHAALAEGVRAWRFRIATTEQFVGTVDAAGKKKVAPLVRRSFHETHGDDDLGITDPGDVVLRLVLPPEAYAELGPTLKTLGMTRAQLVRLLFGGGVRAEAPSQ